MCVCVVVLSSKGSVMSNSVTDSVSVFSLWLSVGGLQMQMQMMYKGHEMSMGVLL